MTGARVGGAGAAARQARSWRASGERVALADGSFDLLGAAHARFLAEARGDAHRLVVAVLDDASAHARLGAGRPVTRAAERARLVAALRGVDHVVICDEAGLRALEAELGPDRRASDREDRAGLEQVTRLRALHGER
jgi:bifunctional ADP-heptose synthase (sugar kinase/adenylyltransferase)